jgi:hypothetical protein
VLIKELQSLALDVKVLTENREEVDIKTPEDEMGESERREYGLLMGDEQSAVSQTAVATREAVAEAPVEVEEEEEEEIDDSKPLDAGAPIPPPVVAPVAEIEAEEVFADEEETPDDEVEGPQGYELEEEDEDAVYEDEKPAYEGDEEEAPFTENPPEEEF